MKKALMISNVISMIIKFNMENIHILQDMGYEVHVACNIENTSFSPKEVNDQYVEKLEEMGVSVHQVDFGRRFDAYKTMFACVRQIREIIRTEKVELVHCHSQIGGLCGRMAAHQEKIKSIYTAHGFMFYKGASLLNWLLFFPQEWLQAKYTDVLITINKEDYQRAKRWMNAKKVAYIPGIGVDTSKFVSTVVDLNEKKKVMDLPSGAKIILSVGEVNQNKNHRIVIEAMAGLQDKTIHYMIAGKGEYDKVLAELAKKEGVSERIHLLGYRNDVAELYQTADLYVHPSYREGLPVAVMEAMSSKISVICSDIRGNRDLVNEKWRFQPDDVKKLQELLELFFCMDREERERLAVNNLKKIEKYDVTCVNRKMKDIYLGLE